jgi:hypothetical protein
MRSLLLLSALASFAACATTPSKDDPGSPDAGGATDAATAPTDAASDAPPAYLACADASRPASLSCGTLAWAKSPVAAARPRNHHLTEIVETSSGPYLFEMGGYNGSAGIFANVDAAPIAADGSLGKWVSQTPLLYGTAGSTGGVVGNVLVVAGGNVGISISTGTMSAVVNGDGTVGSWKQGPAMAHARMHAGSFVQGNSVYVLGGFDGQTVYSDIAKTTVSADGTLSAWAVAGQLPMTLSHFSVSLVGNYVYITGGLNMSAYDDPPALTTVYRGEIAADGTLGGWTTMTPLPEPLATQASFVYGGYLYVGGGIYVTATAGDEVKSVWRTPIDATGTLGAWKPVASLLIARGHVHQLPMFENHVYSLAGAIDFNLDSTSELDIGTLQ